MAKKDEPIEPSEFHERDKILFKKQHESDRYLECKFNEIHAITRSLEREVNEENILRYERFNKHVDVAISIMENDEDNEDLLNLNEDDWAFIKEREQEILIRFYTMKNKARELINSHINKGI